MVRWIALMTMLFTMSAAAQWPQLPRSLPPQKPIPGAPTTSCSFANVNANNPIRLTAGMGMIPYQFACGLNRPAGVCAQGSLPSGLVVNLGAQQNAWACVTGGDSTTGWVPADRLSKVPSAPGMPTADWLGWWHQKVEPTSQKGNRLLITRKRGSSLLHVSGRAYWYGLGDNVHVGQVNGDARATGVYLHVVESSPGELGCVIDLKYDLAKRSFDSYDNGLCGGMNVRFTGRWYPFKPK